MAWYNNLIDCSRCNGTGTLECRTCDGDGIIRAGFPLDIVLDDEECPRCDGGFIDCPKCDGTGEIEDDDDKDDDD